MSHFSVARSLGPVVVSTWFSFFTMATTLSVGVRYALKFPHDRLVFQALVALVLLFGVADTVCSGTWTYSWAVTNYGNPAIQATVPVELIVQGFFMSVTIWIVQLFYAWRLWMISNKALLVPLLIATLSCAQVGAAIWIGVFLANNRSYAGLGGMDAVGWAWIILAEAADVVITASMWYFLLGKRDLRYSFHRNAFRRVFMRMVETNALSLFVQCACTPLYAKKATVGSWFLLFNMTMVKIYAFSLIVSRKSNLAPSSFEGV